jgi:hypothetical protein
MRRIDVRNRKVVLLGIAVAAVVLFVAGIGAAYHARNDHICPDGRPPISQRQAILEPSEYLCHGGVIVTK